MKLATIYNVFSDSLELLSKSIKSIEHISDHIIIVYSNYSNSGEYKECIIPDTHPKVTLVNADKLCKPVVNTYTKLAEKERGKRQMGLEVAKTLGCTHFLLIDSDEVYDREEIANAWFVISASELYDATYVRLYTYFLDMNVRLAGHDDYAVPFICKLKPNTRLKAARWGMAVDPTRCYLTLNNKLFEGVSMHHYSWIRENIEEKIKFSTSNSVIEKKRSELEWDLENALEFMYSKFYSRKLEKV